MNKVDYLVEAFNHRAWSKKAFLLSISAIIAKTENDKVKAVGYGLQRDWESNTCFFQRPGSEEKIIIDNAVCNKPLFVKNEVITLRPETCEYVKEVTETTYGRLLINAIVIDEAFKRKVGFVNREITSKDLKGFIKNMMVDNPGDGESVPEGKASVDECLKLTKQMDYLVGLNNVFVKAASLDAFTIDPKIKKLKDTLIKDLKANNRQNDPVALAEVIDKLVDEDRKAQHAGPSRDLYISDGFISNNRKKMFLVYGAEPDFHTGEYELLDKSLDEGWDLDKLTAYANTAIAGSYSRSISVALAGADVKNAIRLTGHISAMPGDCGSTRGERVKITRNNFNGWVGGYYLVEGKPVLITENDFGKLDNKVIDIRVPQYCQQEKGNLCSICCGDKLGKLKNRISSSVALVYTRFMLQSMKAMHVSVLQTRLITLKDIIR